MSGTEIGPGPDLTNNLQAGALVLDTRFSHAYKQQRNTHTEVTNQALSLSILNVVDLLHKQKLLTESTELMSEQQDASPFAMNG